MRYVFGVLVMLVCAGAAWGETITVLSAGAFRAVIETSGGAYTQATGDRIAITSDTAGGLVRRLLAWLQGPETAAVLAAKGMRPAR